jgi:hypothetical protein
MPQAGPVDDERLMLAGEFGAASRVSPKALRLYAEQRLLVPSCTPQTHLMLTGARAGIYSMYTRRL